MYGSSKSCGCLVKDISSNINTIDETGNRYGSLVVLERAGRNNSNQVTWRCICDCGEEIITAGQEIRSGKKISCVKCGRKRISDSRLINRDGQRFGKLVIIKRNEYDIEKADCICDCGNKTTVSVPHLVNGSTVSCGCYLHEKMNTLDVRIKLSARNQGIPVEEWNGFVGSERERERNKFTTTKWRRSVLKRDKYACQRCGFKANENKNTSLNAHHIVGFSENEELRFDVDNGITLCEKCHSFECEGSFHRIYGTKNNGREQTDEFIRSYKG